MLSKEFQKLATEEIISYTFPQLHEGKTCFVDFFAYDPVSAKMKRKKIMLTRFKTRRERHEMAAQIINNLIMKLRSGWSPFVMDVQSRSFTSANDVLDKYRDYVQALNVKNVLKKKTVYDYMSRLKIFEEYIRNLATPIIYIGQVNSILIVDFLDYILLDRDADVRTRNNYRTWLSTLCTWLVDKKYISENPCESVKQLSEHDKFRQPLSKADLRRMKNYLLDYDKYYLLACMMEYYTFIRPDELSNIKLDDIYIHEQKVFVSSTISKNRRDGMVGLNEHIIRLMIDLNIFNYTNNCYLFGKNFHPSEAKADSRIFRDRFAKLRRELHFPLEYQFYSLKDSGIRDLANAEGIVVAKEQARHTDISTTNRYLQGRDLAVNECTKHFDGEL